MQKKQKSLWNECSWGQIKLNSSEILQKLKKKKKNCPTLIHFCSSVAKFDRWLDHDQTISD